MIKEAIITDLLAFSAGLSYFASLLSCQRAKPLTSAQGNTRTKTEDGGREGWGKGEMTPNK